MNMLNVLLIENDLDNTLLENSLKDYGFRYLKSKYSPAFLALTKEITPDIIIFNLDTPSKKLLTDLQTLNQQSPIPVIMFAGDSNIDTINQAIKAEVSAFIVDSVEHNRINSIINVAIARFKHQQSLNNALEEARAKLEDRKQIDRAKAILIKTQNFTEDDAYHTLRKLAMDRNITLGEMAKNVIAMSELFK
ncbi:MAG: ANTAR domain-containing protein [Methylococcaceae bacterium]|jgi:response regulator NasT|nr:ANTAR domain-containing protein [Methylococcaceae bacterium]MDD1629080.1 ANTAR domain-containing protein [Methylococcaceae bacterium]MDD1640204.1 ANTAR domain-containing protein [Methylococcaceae bacterium]OYV23373.1 MAG: response regulator NasT [Methylococcaceae bacterium NSO1]